MPDSRPSAERVLSAQIAAATRWGRCDDRSTATKAARDGLRRKFEREVDPDGTLPSDEREYRVQQLLTAHMLRMTLRAQQSRRAKAAGRTPMSEPTSGAA